MVSTEKLGYFLSTVTPKNAKTQSSDEKVSIEWSSS